NRLVGRRNVRVRSDDRRDPAVQVPPHRHFFRGRLRVHVDDDDFHVAGARQLLIGDAERRVGIGGHDDRPLQIQYAHRNPGRGRLDRPPAPRIAGRIVGRAQQPIRGVERVVDLLLVPDVIARREDVDRHLGHLVEELNRQAEAASRVLDVDDYKVYIVFVDDLRQRGVERATSGLTDDVADKEDVHDVKRETLSVKRRFPALRFTFYV